MRNRGSSVRYFGKPILPKWQTWIYKLHLKATCDDPVNDLFNIVNSAVCMVNPHNNTAIRFGCKDANGMEFFINCVGDGKIVLIEDVLRLVFTIMLSFH